MVYINFRIISTISWREQILYNENNTVNSS